MTPNQTIVSPHPRKGGCGEIVLRKFVEFCHGCGYKRRAARKKEWRRRNRATALLERLSIPEEPKR